ncbi:hypothetical protein Acr_18g0008410 [Actinidia rufa]|uniref:Uncharacterized protein n=1 Tax=Actinidia rufa TaxID=165716 RepID=A0A7J0G7B7_9ERIC|nr:hypothetical protein Acr_18g0008410 [Actinidia rufa]
MSTSWDLSFITLRFDSGQTLTDFYNKMSNLWNHLAQFEPTWTCPTDADAFYAYRDRSHLCHFLMALPPDYEHIRASLLHRHPLPTVGQALAELRSEETRKKTMVYQHSQACSGHTCLGTSTTTFSVCSGVLARKICLLDLRSNTVASVDETLTPMKIVALASSPNARGTTIVRLLLSLTLLGPSPDFPSSTLTTADVETIVTQFYHALIHSSAALSTTSGSPPSPSLPSRIMAVPNVSPPTAPPSVPCPPVRSSTRSCCPRTGTARNCCCRHSSPPPRWCSATSMVRWRTPLGVSTGKTAMEKTNRTMPWRTISGEDVHRPLAAPPLH